MTKRNAARAHSKATDPTVWTSVARAATALGVSRQTIYTMVATGRLGADHVAGRLVIRNDSLATAMAAKSGTVRTSHV